MKQILPEDSSGLLRYEIAEGVSAFSPLRDAALLMQVVQAHQVHGDRIAVVTSGNTTRTELDGYDALVTDIPGIAIGARTADCIPVLMYDPTHRAIAAVHSGWKGTVLKIAAKTLSLMADLYGTSPEDILTVIGPGIGPDSFQVGPEVTEAFLRTGFPESWTPAQPHLDSFPEGCHELHLEVDARQIIPIISDCGPRIPGSMSGGLHIDLWQANRWILTEAGVPDSQILVSGIDTFTHNGFYSARREGISCGRTVNTIIINP